MSTTVEYILKIEASNAQGTLKKVAKALDSVGVEGRQLDSSLSKASGSIKDAANKTEKLGKSAKKTKRDLLSLASDLGNSFNGIKGAASTAANGIKMIATAAIDAAKAMFELTTSVVDNINDLNDLSTVSGISAQNIEALRTAFVASGQSADQANTILKMFPRIMNQLSNETSDASKVFRGLGLSLKDASGNAKSADQVFIEMIHAVQGIDDQTQKARTAMALFGRQASGVVQALGADKFEAFTDAVERYGTRAGPEASESAAQFQKNLALLDLVSKRAKQSFVESTGVLKFFENALKQVTASISALNVFLQVGADGIRKLGQVGLIFINLVLRQLFEGFKKLVLQGMKPTFDLLNMLSEQVTGKSIFGNLAQTIADLTINTFDLNDAVDAGMEAYKKEMEVLNENTSTKDDASKTAEQLKKDYELIAGVLAKLNKANKKNTKDTKDNTDAKKEQQRIEKLRLATLKMQEKLGNALQKQAEKRNAAFKEVRSIMKDSESDQMTALEKINQLEQERLDRLALIAKQHGVNISFAKKEVKERAKRERKALQQQNTVGALGVAQTAIGAVSDPSAMIGAIGSAFGPVGSAIGGIVQALSSLGQKDPEEIKEEFRATFEGIAQGIKILVPLLIEALPPILFDAARSIIDAVIQLPFSIAASLGKFIKNIIDGIKNFFSGKTFFKAIGDAIGEMFERLVKLITEPFEGLFGGSKMGGGRMLSGQGGLRFTGGDGLAMLHQGEMVVPRSGQISSRVAQDVQSAMGGSGSINITINSIVTERSAIDELVEKIQERFGSFGQSTSPLFGGR